MTQTFHDGVPGAYVTRDGIPDGCVQLPVYQPWDKYDPDASRLLAAYFLIDRQFEDAIKAIPTHGYWRIQENKSCTFATAWQIQPDRIGHNFRLHEEIWKTTVRPTIPDGFRVVTANRDWFDCRACNIRLLRKVTLEIQRERGLIRQRDTRG
jgi:hypothetical protein